MTNLKNFSISILFIFAFITFPIHFGYTLDFDDDRILSTWNNDPYLWVDFIFQASLSARIDTKLNALSVIEVAYENRIDLFYTENAIFWFFQTMAFDDYVPLRKEAARYLGYLGTPDALRVLFRMGRIDSESVVVQEVIRSLGLFTFEQDLSVEAIVHFANRFNQENPAANLLALAAIDSLYKIAQMDYSYIDRNAIQFILSIDVDGRYVNAIKNRARHLIIYIHDQMRSQQQQ